MLCNIMVRAWKGSDDDDDDSHNNNNNNTNKKNVTTPNTTTTMSLSDTKLLKLTDLRNEPTLDCLCFDGTHFTVDSLISVGHFFIYEPRTWKYLVVADCTGDIQTFISLSMTLSNLEVLCLHWQDKDNDDGGHDERTIQNRSLFQVIGRGISSSSASQADATTLKPLTKLIISWNGSVSIKDMEYLTSALEQSPQQLLKVLELRGLSFQQGSFGTLTRAIQRTRDAAAASPAGGRLFYLNLQSCKIDDSHASHLVGDLMVNFHPIVLDVTTMPRAVSVVGADGMTSSTSSSSLMAERISLELCPNYHSLKERQPFQDDVVLV